MVAVAAADEEPGGVRDERCGQAGQQCQGKADLVLGGEGSGGQQDRRGGQRYAKLLNQDPDEQQQVTVGEENVCGQCHWTVLSSSAGIGARSPCRVRRLGRVLLLSDDCGALSLHSLHLWRRNLALKDRRWKDPMADGWQLWSPTHRAKRRSMDGARSICRGRATGVERREKPPEGGSSKW